MPRSVQVAIGGNVFQATLGTRVGRAAFAKVCGVHATDYTTGAFSG